MQTPEQVVKEHDKAKRIEEEEEILTDAESLTNGHAGDPQITGKVLHWQVKETVTQGVLLRTLVDTLADFEQIYQRKTQCILAHQPKRWQVKLFGVSFSVPMSVMIATCGWLFFMACRKQGWM